MARKNQIQPKQATPTRQSDAVFTQLLITAVADGAHESGDAGQV